MILSPKIFNSYIHRHLFYSLYTTRNKINYWSSLLLKLKIELNYKTVNYNIASHLYSLDF